MLFQQGVKVLAFAGVECPCVCPWNQAKVVSKEGWGLVRGAFTQNYKGKGIGEVKVVVSSVMYLQILCEIPGGGGGGGGHCVRLSFDRTTKWSM